MKKIRLLTIICSMFSVLVLCACTFEPNTKNKKNMQEEVQKEVIVLIGTPYGDLKAKLYNETPKHRDNFVKLVKEGFYNATLFHRVINSFMIQGGDPDSKGAKPDQMLGGGGLNYTIPAEIVSGKFHQKGALAAARMGDQMNPTKASSSCQFYIAQGQVYTKEQLNMFVDRYGLQFSPEQIEIYTTVGGVPHLDNEYTVFGQIIEGLDIIDLIGSKPVNSQDRPVEDIRMTIKILK